MQAGATVRAFDPVAMANLNRELPEVETVDDMYAALTGCDALVVCTESNEYRNPDFERDRPGAQDQGDLRRPQHLQAPPDGATGLHLLLGRPTAGERGAERTRLVRSLNDLARISHQRLHQG